MRNRQRVELVGVLVAGLIVTLTACEKVPIEGSNSIYAVAESGDMLLLGDMLQKGFDVNQPDADGMTLLHHASAANRPEIAEMLVNEFGANVTLVDKQGRTPLDIASEMGNEDVAIVLEQEAGM